MSKLVNDIWKDTSVKARLKEGKSPDDIYVMDCPNCNRFGYYNQGSHFFCRFCKQGWYCLADGEQPPDGRQYLHIDDHIRSLADTVTVTTDGYDNHTL